MNWVTLTGKFLNLGGPRFLAVEYKDKDNDVGSTQGSSSTPTDPEILELLGDLENTINMPPRKRNLEASLQAAAAGAGQSSSSNKSPIAGRQKRQKKEPIRYGFRKDLIKSPSPPHVAEKLADDGAQAREVIADLTVEEVRPADVGNIDDELPTIWRPSFRYKGNEMMESDSIYSSTLVAATIMYGVKKASNMAEHAKTNSI